MADALAKGSVTANHITLAAIFLSIGAGAFLAWSGDPRYFLILPLVLFVRMALNAIDGMIAREHNQVTRLGMFLNEIGDVVSDIALVLPFAVLPQFAPSGVVAFALAAMLSEFSGVLAVVAGGQRRYDGPMGKSDRALALGVMAVIVWLGVQLPEAVAALVFPALALLALLTMANRARKALT